MDFFKSIVIPVIFVLVGVFASRLGRRDGDNAPMRNHWAVSTTVLLMTCGTILSDCFDQPKSELHVGLISLIIVFGLIWWSVDRDRFASWVRDNDGRPTHEKALWNGILLPNFVAILPLVVYSFRGDIVR